MKYKRSYQISLIALDVAPETIARFGPARLLRHLDGHHELRGGTPADHAAAREWCSLFAPEIVFKNPEPSRRAGRIFRRHQPDEHMPRAAADRFTMQ